MTQIPPKIPKIPEDKNVSIRVEGREETERIRALRARSKHCVCRYCGGALSLRKVTYAAYDESKIELYCEQCARIEYGVEKEIYRVSEYFVEELEYDHYPNMDPSLRKKRMNIAAICDIIAWGFKNTGLLKEDGFTVPLNLDAGVFGEATVIKDSDLRQADTGE